jgi:hypothetical protein
MSTAANEPAMKDTNLDRGSDSAEIIKTRSYVTDRMKRAVRSFGNWSMYVLATG